MCVCCIKGGHKIQILLLNPPAVRFGYYLTDPIPPLGLLYLAQTLRNQGHKVEVLDLPSLNWNFEDILKSLRETKADLVGLSSNIFTVREVAVLVHYIKHIKPHVWTVLGGPCTIFPSKKILEKLPYLDFVIHGDGEEPLLFLCNALETHQSLDNIPNLAYWDKSGQYHENISNYKADISKITEPPMEDVKLSNYTLHPPYGRKKPYMIVSTSRGCVYNCAFCGERLNYRRRSVENVVNELKILKNKYQIREIYFCDPSMTTDRKFLYRLTIAMIKERFNFVWSCKSRVDNLDEKILRFMKAAGCYLIAFGAESADSNVLKALNKQTKPRDLKKAVQLCRNVGIVSLFYFMVGNLGETEQSLQKTEYFIRKYVPDFSVFAPVFPLPGTALNEDKRVKELHIEERMEQIIFSPKAHDWPIYVPIGLTEERINYWVGRLQRSAVFNPRFLFTRIISLRSFIELKTYVKGFLGIVKALIRKKTMPYET